MAELKVKGYIHFRSRIESFLHIKLALASHPHLIGFTSLGREVLRVSLVSHTKWLLRLVKQLLLNLLSVL